MSFLENDFFLLAVTFGIFFEIICHSPELLTTVSHTSHPSDVVLKFTKAFGAIIVALIPSEFKFKFVT